MHIKKIKKFLSNYIQIYANPDRFKKYDIKCPILGGDMDRSPDCGFDPETAKWKWIKNEC